MRGGRTLAVSNRLLSNLGVTAGVPATTTDPGRGAFGAAPTTIPGGRLPLPLLPGPAVPVPLPPAPVAPAFTSGVPGAFGLPSGPAANSPLRRPGGTLSGPAG